MKNDISIGQKFGLLTVIGAPFRESGRTKVPCKCDCGKEKQPHRWHLISGQSKSCGCISRSKIGARNKTHGKTKTPEYRIWRGIIDRCFYPSQKRYARYGGRGITMCSRWKESFEAFIGDMGERPSPEHSIDRIDPDGHYEPTNCRWATLEEQAHSRARLKDSGSGVVGVTRTSEGRWMARIGNNGEVVYLGTFDTLSAAVSCRFEAEAKLWGR